MDNGIVSVFQYKDAPVTFRKENGTLMVNATEMAKSFGKNATHWLRNQSTQEFLTALSELRICNSVDLVQVTYGDNGCTWLHEDVALEFARWLSPAFAIWCNDRIKELLTVGVTATPQTLDAMLNDPDSLIVMLQALKEERAKRAAMEAKAQINAPKVLFADAVATSKRSCLVAELAKILQQNGVQIGQNRLFEWLRSNGYLCSKGQYYNQPTQKAMELGLFDIKQTTITKPDGSILVSCTTKVTGKGQIYFTNKFLGKPQ